MAKTKSKVISRAKKAGKATMALYAKKVEGLERQTYPEHQPINDIELGFLYRWYNLSRSNSDAKAYLLEYLKNTNDPRYDAVAKTSEKLIRPTAGWIARMVSLGLFLSNQQRDAFERLIDSSGRAKPVYDEEGETEAPVNTTVVKRKILSEHDVIGDIEHALDNWRTNPFRLTEYLTERKIPAIYGPAIVNYYDPLLDELDFALEGKTKDLNEGYSRYKKPELKKYYDFVYNIVHEAMAYAQKDTKVKERKPRIKKEIPLDKKVSLVQYLQLSPNHSIKSFDPKRIVGAKELWTFDTVSKRIIVLRAATDAGLDIHRSSVTNYCPKTSTAKKIGRSTNIILDKVFISPRTAARKSLIL
jgi:hypothetical protein